MNKLPDLSEEIAAMAKIDPSETDCPAKVSPSTEEAKSTHSASQPSRPGEQRKKRRKKCRELLVQEIRISVSVEPWRAAFQSNFEQRSQPLSEDMKRELRKHCRRSSKKNKASIRRSETLVKRKISDPASEAPTRKIRKITEGLPNVSKHEEAEPSHSPFSLQTFSSRFNDSVDIKRVKPLNPPSVIPASASASNSPNIASTSSPSPSPSSQILFQLPTLGRKFNSDTKELIMKNTSKASANDSAAHPVAGKSQPALARKPNVSVPQKS